MGLLLLFLLTSCECLLLPVICREKFVINPSATSPLHLQMFEFVGSLMGAALRAKFTLPLDLPSVLWKLLLGDVPDEGDLEAIDKLCLQAIRSLEELPAAEFTELAQPFSTQLSSGGTVELTPGGADRMLTKETVPQFRRLVVQKRLHESKRQVPNELLLVLTRAHAPHPCSPPLLSSLLFSCLAGGRHAEGLQLCGSHWHAIVVLVVRGGAPGVWPARH